VSMPWKMFGMLIVGSMMITLFWSVLIRPFGTDTGNPSILTGETVKVFEEVATFKKLLVLYS